MFTPADVARPMLFVLVLTAIAWGLISFLWRDIEKGAVGASALVVCCILYGQVFHAPQGAVTLSIWCILAITLIVLASWKVKATGILNIISFFLVVSSLGSIMYRTVYVPNESTAGRLPIVGKMAGPDSPDVYYIILDGYGRHDSLQQFMNYSNEDFLDGLRKRGFYVANQSHSNYVQTEISIPSSLNMNFIPNLIPNMDTDATQRVTLDHLATTNEASRQFTARGYKTAVVTSGYAIFDGIPATYEFHGKENRSLFESTLASSSPLASENSDDRMFQQRRDELQGALESVRNMAGRRSSPRFIFTHILAPHPPFVWDAEGRPVRPKIPFGIWDGSDYINSGLTREDYRIGYTGQVTTLNRLVLKTVDAVLAKPGIRPIIIIQGDHGSKRFLDQNDLSKTDVRECFSNLFAILAPPSVQKLIYPTMTPVNELRCVMDGLFDAKFPMLEDRSWYSEFRHPYHFTEVTAPVVAYANLVPKKSSKPTH
jgi:uncharacterized membrane protein